MPASIQSSELAPSKRTITSKFIVFVVSIIAIAGLTYGSIWYWGNQQVAQEVVPTFTPRPSSQASKTYNISNLGLLVTLPDSLSDLTYQVVKLSGDQAVNSVTLSTTRLESAGCPVSSAPLGYLTYDNNKGGVVVAHARGSDLYYLKPTVQCGGTLQDWAGLQKALKTIISDSCSKGETCPTGFICKPPEGYPQSEATCQKTSIVDTSTWKTYTNTQYGFEFKYPLNLKPNVDISRSRALDLDSAGVLYEVSLHWDPIDEAGVHLNYNYVFDVRDKNAPNVKDAIKIASDYPASTNLFVPGQVPFTNGIFAQGDGYGPGQAYFATATFVDNQYYYFSQVSGDKYSKPEVDIFEQIISTFKFSK